MNEFIKFLTSLGFDITINENSSPVMLFALVILVLAIICLLCIINIIIYLGVLSIDENNSIFKKIKSNVLLLTIFNFYKKTRLYYLVFEFTLLIVNVLVIIWLCFRVVHGLYGITTITDVSDVNLTYNNPNEVTIENLTENIGKSIPFFILLKNTIKNNKMNTLMVILLLIVPAFFLLIENFPLILKYLITLRYSDIKKICMVLNILVIIYYTLSLIIFILFSKKIIQINEYLPSFSLNWLTQLKELSEIENKRIIVDMFVKEAFIYIFFLLIFIFIV